MRLDDVIPALEYAAPQRRRRVIPAWWRSAKRAALGGVLVGVVAGVPAMLWITGAPTAGRPPGELLARMSLGVGLKVEEIYVEGRDRTPPERLLDALDIERNDPILSLDLEAARQRIEALPWVSTASIERRLPDTLFIHIDERHPVALWQHRGQFMLIDRDGRALGDPMGEFGELPLVVGEEAPKHAAALIDVLALEPDLMKRVKAAVRVSARRWNLKLDDIETGIEVRLPEEAADEAWRRLGALERQHRLLERRVATIDLRLPDRLILGAGTSPQPALPVMLPGRKPVPGKDA